MITARRTVSVVSSVALVLALMPALPIDVAQKAFAEPVAKEFKTGDAASGIYYYRTVESAAGGGSEIASDTQARLIAIDLRNTADGFNGEVKIPATVSNDNHEYSVTSASGKTPDEFKPEGYDVHTDSNATLFLAANDSSNVDGVGMGYNNNENLAKVKSVTIGKNLQKLGGCSFAWCQNLTSVQYENESALVEIGREAFGYDTSLVSVCVGDTAESGKYDLQPLTHLTTVGSRAFGGCTKLVELDVPASVASFGTPSYGANSAGAFYAEKLVFKKGSALSEMPVFGSGSQTTGYLNYAPQLRSIDFGENATITTIPIGAFRGLTNLESVQLPNSLVSIQMSAFQDCSELKSVDIPDGVQEVGQNAFRGCGSLESANIPNSVTVLGTGTFWGCSKLVSATIGDGVEGTGTTFNQCVNLKEVILGSSVKTVGQRTFAGCTALEKVSVRHKGELSFGVMENAGTVYHAFMNAGSAAPSASLAFAFERGDTAANIVDADNKTFSSNNKFITKQLDVYGNSEALRTTCETLNNKAKYTENGTEGYVAVVYHEIADNSALTAALTAAPENVAAAKAKYVVAEGAADVATGTQFVTQAAVDALDAAIADAQAVADDVTATSEQIEAATASIDAAIKAFEDSAAAGTNDVLAVDAVIAGLPAAPAENASATDAAAYKDAVAAALAAYDALTDEEQANVSELPALLAAQRAVAARDAADAQAAAAQAAGDLQAAQQAAQESADKVKQLESDLATAQAAAAKQVTLAKPVLTAKTKSAKKGKITVAWNKVAKATGYELKVGKKTYTIKKATTLKKVVKAKKGKKVKVQVRAFAKQGTNTLYSPWSKAKKVKVKK